MTYRIAAIAIGAAMTLPAAIANPDTPQLHPVDAVCIDYEQSGQMQSGTSTRCHRDYGYEQYEISELTIGMAGFSQTQSTFTVTIGETIYAIDEDANTATATVNPMYQPMVDAVAQSGSNAVSGAFLSAMGLTPTGQTQTVVGLTCNVYSSSMMGSACLTDDGLMLEQNVMGTQVIATAVTYDEGIAENYRRHESATITQGPDLSNGLGGLLNQLQ
ncbi:MAG: hypothetical protein VXW22_06740 [Pseudomonadota bacterium]|nr:hypothetical protein [Pseudomonadota bacterium]